MVCCSYTTPEWVPWRYPQIKKFIYLIGTLKWVTEVPITPNTKQYSQKYFGINSCWNILFSHVLSAHIMVNAEQYSPKYFSPTSCQKILFLHGFSAHVPKLHTVFHVVFQPQELPKYFIFLCIKCTYYS